MARVGDGQCDTNRNISPREAKFLLLKDQVLCPKLFIITSSRAVSHIFHVIHTLPSRVQGPEHSNWAGSDSQGSFSPTCFHKPMKYRRSFRFSFPAAPFSCQFCDIYPQTQSLSPFINHISFSCFLFLLIKKIYILLIYLAALGLSCSLWDLVP